MCIWPVFKSILVGLTKNLDQKEIIAKKSQDFPKTAFICISFVFYVNSLLHS